ncbi:hypothetical protein BIV04_11440 [Frigoribacterium sp. MCBA15_019]|nr:hypothetical protein BIV04_11440 [Frigoribacterium sp. MCBA15_019]
MGEEALYLDLHHLCEQALIVLRSREDFSDMINEVDPVGPNEQRKEDTERVVARNYDAIRWFSFEVEPNDGKVAERFRWGGSTSLIPYFEVEHKGTTFSSRDMGLGEFSIHFLFWVLEQYRDVKGLTLLLDEPDAYLPPLGSSGLLVRLLQLCLSRDWSLVLSTHSTEMIERALEREAFVLLRVDESGAIEATRSKDDPGAADTLMSPAPIRNILFVEDESAWMLCTVLMEAGDRRLPPVSSVIWGKGAGYMVTLQEHFPRSPASMFSYSYVFDGDQRQHVKKSKTARWPALFLPTSQDPDELFVTNAQNVPELARRLNVPEHELSLFLDGKQGLDPHDWVNDLGVKYGRQKVLRVLAEMWVANHSAEAESWYADLTNAL